MEFILIPERIFLKNESEKTLNSLADFLKKNPNIKLEIIGHTDSDGDEVMNQ